ncbi:MAG: hypothetical protein LWW97_12705 [Deltaproteobacteria bacterium]|jgi:hypothetical protein|nr:hypothetical protein [Deltaproteobacteria bacterium]
MKNLQQIVQEGIGVIFGIFLFFIWYILLKEITFYFFGESIVVNHSEMVRLRITGQAFPWFCCGLIPFFIFAGHYLLYSNIIGGIEKTKDIVAMKSFFAGFTIWLILCVITDLLKVNIPYDIDMWGGYLIMFIFFLIYWKRWNAANIGNP